MHQPSENQEVGEIPLRRSDVSILKSHTLFLGYWVLARAVCTACWSGLLFASCLQSIVGPFAMSISPEPCLFAMIVGRKVSLFASRHVPVRKPLHLWRGQGQFSCTVPFYTV